MKNGLESCPFCGNDNNKILDRIDITNGATTKYKVKCTKCGAETKECSTNFEAISCWNMRNGK